MEATNIPADFLSDANHPLSIDDVVEGPDRNHFRAIRSQDSDAQYVSGWLRFSLRSKNDPERWLLVLPPAYDDADFYVRNLRGGFELTRLGMLVPFNARKYRSLPYPALPISISMVNAAPIYVHFALHGGTVGLFVTTRERALDGAGNDSRDLFTWIGLYLAIGFSNFLLFLYLRDRTFLGYAGVMSVAILFYLVANAWAWQLLWPWASVPWSELAELFNGLYFLALLLFVRVYLNLRERAPRIDKALIALGVLQVSVVIFLMFEPWKLSGLVNLLLLGFTLFFLAALLGCGVVMMLRGVASARFYVIAFAGFVVGFTLADLLSSYFPNVYSWVSALPWPLSDPNQLGVAWDAIFLTFAIADRVQSAKAEAFDALEEREAALKQLSDGQEQMLTRLSAQNTSMERFVPRAFLQHLGKSSVEELRLGNNTLREMTMLFSDIRSFTMLAESMSPQDTFDFINSYLKQVGPLIREHGGFIDKYIGDAIMALFAESASDGLEAAIALQNEVVRYNQARARAGYSAIAIGVGLHRGMLALGTIGESERIETTVIADAVNVASRMEGLTKLFGAKIIVSDSVVANLERPERYRLRSLGRVQVKGASHDLEIFEVFDADSPELILHKVQSLDAFAAGIEAYAAGDFVEAELLFARISDAAPDDRVAVHFAQRCRDLTALGSLAAWDGIEHLEVK